MANRHSLCVHAHFYQPAREDPLTGIIPDEPGAHPYPNWNERIFETCYKPNAALGNFS
ncbi:MAG: glycoside hydrolase family 57, partial [uncultured bacterium]